MPFPKLILASSSVYRQQLLRQLGLSFDCISPNLDEGAEAGESSARLCRRLAEQKALSVWQTHRNAWVIGSDQVADLNGVILGKPGSAERAISQLCACSGQQVRFYSAVSLVTAATPDAAPQSSTRVVVTDVHFRQLSEQQIAAYIKRENPLDCAGSFKCEGLGIALFESIHSEDPSALIGLPLISLTGMLCAHGWDILEGTSTEQKTL